MTKRVQRWAIWKIAVTTASCAVATVVLWWLSLFLERIGPTPTTDPAGRSAALTPASFLMMMGTGAGLGTLLTAIWLVLRIRQARTPAWKRRRAKR